MKKYIEESVGIAGVSADGTIIQTESMLKEIKDIVKIEKENSMNHDKLCIYCYNHIEALDDLCEILNKKTYFCETCDDFKEKMTYKEAVSLGLLDGYEDIEEEKVYELE